ncbi:MAG: hypothetical protein QOF89_5645 [Acidobacteriota bacterium]|jgi:hypothetical protein|nr:hypothetical protein [Acidobacteriota bacterium]
MIHDLKPYPTYKDSGVPWACLPWKHAHPATHERFDQVVRLVDGFETPFGRELLATVHWVATHEQAKDNENIVRATYAWGPRKPQLTPTQIDLAAERLRSEGWLASGTGS